MSNIIQSIITPGDFYFFHAMAFLALFLLNVFRARYYRISILKSMGLTAIIYSFGYVLMLFLFWVESGFQTWGGQNIVRIFAWLWVIAIPVGKMLKIKWQGVADFIAPCLCLNHGIAHFGCVNAGCCYGYPCSWGIYNDIYEDIRFPVQIFEAVTALLITAILLIWDHRRGCRQDGRIYALMLLLFGPTRFIWEFFRANEKIFLGCSSLALHALFMTLVGILAFILIAKKEKKDEAKKREEKKWIYTHKKKHAKR